MSLDEQIDEILVNLDAYKIRFDDFTPEEHYALYPDLKQAKQAIKALIAKAVVEARINQSKHFKKIAHKRKDTRLDNNTYLSCVFEKEIDQEIAELQQLNTDKETNQ